MNQSFPPSNFLCSIPTTDRVVFITIDDGCYKDKSVKSFLLKTRWPITNFINPINYIPDYFIGDFQNHTTNHLNMKNISYETQVSEITSASDFFENLTGIRPTLFRPPYGEFNKSVVKAAEAAGIKWIVNWQASVNNSGIVRWFGNTLKCGDIILLHYVPDLNKQLLMLEKELIRLKLIPARLLDYINKMDLNNPTCKINLMKNQVQNKVIPVVNLNSKLNSKVLIQIRRKK
jgi:hypothetical protein